MLSCPRCSSSNLTRDGRDQRGRPIHACGACGRHATAESSSLVSGHRFPCEVILLAVRYYLQLGAAAERIAGLLADRGIDVSGRTILRWVQKFGPALSEEVRRFRKPLSTTWLVDETYVKILGKWHYLYRGVDLDGQVLDCWLSRTRDLAAALGCSLPWMRCSWSNVTSYACHRSGRRALAGAAISAHATSPRSSLSWAAPCRTGRPRADRTDCGWCLLTPRQCRRTRSAALSSAKHGCTASAPGESPRLGP